MMQVSATLISVAVCQMLRPHSCSAINNSHACAGVKCWQACFVEQVETAAGRLKHVLVKILSAMAYRSISFLGVVHNL